MMASNDDAATLRAISEVRKEGEGVGWEQHSY